MQSNRTLVEISANCWSSYLVVRNLVSEVRSNWRFQRSLSPVNTNKQIDLLERIKPKHNLVLFQFSNIQPINMYIVFRLFLFLSGPLHPSRSPFHFHFYVAWTPGWSNSFYFLAFRSSITRCLHSAKRISSEGKNNRNDYCPPSPPGSVPSDLCLSVNLNKIVNSTISAQCPLLFSVELRRLKRGQCIQFPNLLVGWQWGARARDTWLIPQK